MNLGTIMMDVSGLTLSEKEKTQLGKSSIGGVILFSRNFEDIYQVKSLIHSIRLTNQNLLIAVDHEGGRVQRFRKGFTHLPAMAKLGDIYDKNPTMSREMLTHTFHARIMHAFNQAAGQLHHHIRVGMEGSIANHRRCEPIRIYSLLLTTRVGGYNALERALRICQRWQNSVIFTIKIQLKL
jgi:hypothetical protein